MKDQTLFYRMFKIRQAVHDVANAESSEVISKLEVILDYVKSIEEDLSDEVSIYFVETAEGALVETINLRTAKTLYKGIKETKSIKVLDKDYSLNTILKR